jgi:hypothetical protein
MNKRKSSFIILTLTLFLCFILISCGGPSNGPTGVSFDSITLADIQATTLSSANIDGNNDNTNMIPTGTIVVYKTNEGRYGKFLVASYGYDLVINWVTYNLANDGSIYSQGTNLTIHGTFSADLDLGVETAVPADEDFFWEIIDASAPSPKQAQIVPENGATFAVYN